MGKLILARHHQSEWNKLGKWTGLYDSPLDPYGVEKASDMGTLIQDLSIDQALTSALTRTKETLAHMLTASDKHNVPTEHAAALNERDYGDYTGKNKFEMQAILGDEEYKKLRRSWDYLVPNGETLKMVYDRVVPFYKEEILPQVHADKNVLAVAHGNSLRALIKYIEGISDEGIADVEMPFGAILIYEVDHDGRILSKEVRQTESHVHA
ncbi:MAG: 2,3-diphosphoglycerate-dependent phosphoglycerate mutase [Candidatus Paceibacterota bacterium]